MHSRIETRRGRQEAERRERETLDQEVTHVLEEARMILPGIQALFGFQLVAVFSERFETGLGETHQRLHAVAIAWIVLAMGFVMTPAAYHRQAERGFVTTRLTRVGSRLLQLALASLAVGVAVDIHVVAWMVFGTEEAARSWGLVSYFALVALWFGYPALARVRSMRR